MRNKGTLISSSSSYNIMVNNTKTQNNRRQVHPFLTTEGLVFPKGVEL